MNRSYSHFAEVDMIGKLADLKEDHYKNTLVLNAIVELLLEKGVFTLEEIRRKTLELDTNFPNSAGPRA